MRMTQRSRVRSVLLGAVAIALGLGSRKFGHALPSYVAEYAGDTLWALVAYLGVGFLFPRISIRHAALAAALFATCIEISQLHHAPWIDAIRRTRLGGLVLGFGFLWSDLVCYAVGIGVGAAIDGATRGRAVHEHRGS